ncbi:hypothetical protein LPB140_07830 [Sphingorhabdus lutea]|uniref:Nitrogen regulatory protein P-II n=1 Tax=Sphingorhabdus lutea TaxID=1913578 RepID=A0A1L3JC59_9SPHN|nr:hypothetical protein [Sphingorhabdus lutea]APG62716.1 hypothetical protein LPB140_07830 [Sphingorhabdus lutea]
MVETVIRKRIEILVDTPLIPHIIDLLKKVDMSGWSVIHVDSGGGRDGEWSDDDFTGASAKSIILVIASEEKTNNLVDLIAPILDSHRLLLTVANVAVVRGHKF